VSVTHGVQVKHHVWGGDTDPSYPISTWFAQMVLMGDASGGTSSLLINLARSHSDVLDASFWSVEQIDCYATGNATVVGIIRSTNLADVGMHVGIAMAATPLQIGSVSRRDPGGRIRRFLGHMGDPGLGCGISLVTQNTSGIQISFEAQGYQWGSRSRSTPGGPKYPPGAILL